MKSYALTDDHELFIHDPKKYYKNSDWLYSIVNQMRLRLNVHSVALYMFDSWADQYARVQSISAQETQLPERLPSEIVSAQDTINKSFNPEHHHTPTPQRDEYVFMWLFQNPTVCQHYPA